MRVLISPSPTRTVSAAQTVTEAETGVLVTMRVGQRLHVLLQPPRGLGNWTKLALNGHGLTIVSARGGYPTTQALDVVLEAVAPGDSHVVTGTDMACLHTTPPCLPPQLEWAVNVRVSP
ncbi:MAG: hypothetical protein ACRDNS_26555 [Trebonia sp.]